MKVWISPTSKGKVFLFLLHHICLAALVSGHVTDFTSQNISMQQKSHDSKLGDIGPNVTLTNWMIKSLKFWV